MLYAVILHGLLVWPKVLCMQKAQLLISSSRNSFDGICLCVLHSHAATITVASVLLAFLCTVLKAVAWYRAAHDPCSCWLEQASLALHIHAVHAS